MIAQGQKRRKEDDGNSQQEQQLFCSEKFSKDMHEFLPEILREKQRIVGYFPRMKNEWSANKLHPFLHQHF